MYLSVYALEIIRIYLYCPCPYASFKSYALEIIRIYLYCPCPYASFKSYALEIIRIYLYYPCPNRITHCLYCIVFLSLLEKDGRYIGKSQAFVVEQ